MTMRPDSTNPDQSGFQKLVQLPVCCDSLCPAMKRLLLLNKAVYLKNQVLVKQKQVLLERMKQLMRWTRAPESGEETESQTQNPSPVDSWDQFQNMDNNQRRQNPWKEFQSPLQHFNHSVLPHNQEDQTKEKEVLEARVHDLMRSSPGIPRDLSSPGPCESLCLLEKSLVLINQALHQKNQYLTTEKEHLEELLKELSR